MTASAWEGFSDDNEVTIVDSGFHDFGTADDPGDTLGDMALGLSVIPPAGWSGFFRATLSLPMTMKPSPARTG